MPLQVITGPTSRAQLFGESLGTGLGEGLAYLAAHKIGQLQDTNFQKDLVSKGYSPQEAEYITYLRRNNPSQYQAFREFELRNAAVQQQPLVTQQQAYPQQLQQPQVPLSTQFEQPSFNQAPRLEELFKGLQQPLGEQAPFLKQLAQQLPQQQFAELPQAQPTGIQALPQYQQAPELQQMAPQMQPQVSPTSPVPAETLQEITQPEVTKAKKARSAVQQFIEEAPKKELSSEEKYGLTQAQIRSDNKVYLTGLNEGIKNAEAQKKDAEYALKLLKSGKISTGVMANLPTFDPNNELYENRLNKLVNRAAAELGGVPTEARIQLAKDSKLARTMQPQTQEAILNNLIEEADNIINLGNIRDDIIKENKGQIPDIDVAIRERLAQRNNLSEIEQQQVQPQQNIPQQSIPQQQKQQPETQPQPTQEKPIAEGSSPLVNVVNEIGRNLKRAGFGFLTAPSDIATGLYNLSTNVTGATPLKAPAEELREKNPDLRPQNLAEEIFDMTAIDLPILLATGGTGIPNIGARVARSLASNIGGVTARELGAGPVGQIAASWGGGTLFDLARRGVTPARIKQAAGVEQKKAYNLAEKNEPHQRLRADDLQKQVIELVNEHERGLKTPANKEISKHLNTLENHLASGSTTVPAMVRMRKQFNKVLSDLDDIPENRSRRGIYKQVIGDIDKSFLDKYGQEFPDWYLPWKRGQAISAAILTPSIIEKTLGKKLFKYADNPLALSALGVGYLAGIPAAKLAIGGGIYQGARIAETIAHFSKTPHARSILFKIMQDSAIGDKAGLINHVKLLNNAAKDFEKNNQ